MVVDKCSFYGVFSKVIFNKTHVNYKEKLLFVISERESGKRKIQLIASELNSFGKVRKRIYTHIDITPVCGQNINFGRKENAQSCCLGSHQIDILSAHQTHDVFCGRFGTLCFRHHEDVAKKYNVFYLGMFSCAPKVHKSLCFTMRFHEFVNAFVNIVMFKLECLCVVVCQYLH